MFRWKLPIYFQCFNAYCGYRIKIKNLYSAMDIGLSRKMLFYSLKLSVNIFIFITQTYQSLLKREASYCRKSLPFILLSVPLSPPLCCNAIHDMTASTVEVSHTSATTRHPDS
jgi:hypothetical protein